MMKQFQQGSASSADAGHKRKMMSLTTMDFLTKMKASRDAAVAQATTTTTTSVDEEDKVARKRKVEQQQQEQDSQRSFKRQKQQIIDFASSSTTGFQTTKDKHAATTFQASTNKAYGIIDSNYINSHNSLVQQTIFKHGETRGEVKLLTGYIANAKDRHFPNKKYQCDETYMVADITPIPEGSRDNDSSSSGQVVQDFTDKVRVCGRVPYALPSCIYQLKIQETFSNKQGWQWRISECLTRPRLDKLMYLKKYLNSVLLHDLEESEEAVSMDPEDIQVKKLQLKADIAKDINSFVKAANQGEKDALKQQKQQQKKEEENDDDSDDIVCTPPLMEYVTADEYIAKNWKSWLETLPYGEQILQSCVTKEASIGKLYPLIDMCYDGKSLFMNNSWWSNMTDRDRSRWNNALKNPVVAMQMCFRETFPSEFKFQGTFVTKEVAKNRERRALLEPKPGVSYDPVDQHQRDALDLEYALEELACYETSTQEARYHTRATSIPPMQLQGFKELCSRMNWVGDNVAVTPQQILHPPLYIPSLHKHMAAMEAYDALLELTTESDASCCINWKRLSAQHHEGLNTLIAKGILHCIQVDRKDYCTGHPHPDTFNAECTHVATTIEQQQHDREEGSSDVDDRCCNMLIPDIWFRCKTLFSRLLCSFRCKFEEATANQNQKSKKKKSKNKKAPFQIHWDRFVLPRKYRSVSVGAADGISAEDIFREEEDIKQSAKQANKRVLSDTQYEFLKQVEENPIVILTGGPGVGKTTMLALLDEATCSDMHVGAYIGRAVKNVQARVKCKASTLHSLIAQQQQLRSKAFNVFCFDEAGTIQERLLMKFFSAGWVSERIVLVGDIDQIPPFGSYRGNIMFELMQEFPVMTLTEVHRQSKTNPDCKILENAYRVIGKATSLRFDSKSFRMRTQTAHLDRIIDEHALKHFEHVQFICGTNAHCGDINLRVFHKLTDNKFKHLRRDAALNSFTPGQRIVFSAKVTRMSSDPIDEYFNYGYYAETNQLEKSGRTLFVNGEQDTIDKIVSAHDLPDNFWNRHVTQTTRDITSNTHIIRNRVDDAFHQHRTRMKKDPVGAALDSHKFPVDSNILLILRSGRVVRLSDTFSLGYAVTINKLQGGEDKHIILYCPQYQTDRFLVKYFSRNHLYTSITRATESFTAFVDSIQDLLQMMQTDPPIHHCYLRKFIRDARIFLAKQQVNT